MRCQICRLIEGVRKKEKALQYLREDMTYVNKQNVLWRENWHVKSQVLSITCLYVTGISIRSSISKVSKNSCCSQKPLNLGTHLYSLSLPILQWSATFWLFLCSLDIQFKFHTYWRHHFWTKLQKHSDSEEQTGSTLFPHIPCDFSPPCMCVNSACVCEAWIRFKSKYNVFFDCCLTDTFTHLSVP